ncbi:MAG: hypothetical protein CL824_05120 [Crocinitomicaceae bacterium]|nr:hypothetical protein [Crocinitomicaceae bacterium]
MKINSQKFIMKPNLYLITILISLISYWSNAQDTPEPPKADFTCDKRLVEANSVVEFTNNSSDKTGELVYKWKVSGGEKGKNWDFEKGSSLTDENPNILFKTVGHYSVALSVKNSETKQSAKISRKNYISVIGNYGLNNYYSDGDYEKLVKSAEKYTLNDKYKKDPIPYLWLSRGLYQIKQSGLSETDQKWKNAVKDAMKALSKAVKYDYNGIISQDFRFNEYLQEFQGFIFEEEGIEMILEAILTSDQKPTEAEYKKAESVMSKYMKISFNTLGPKFILLKCYGKLKLKDKAKELMLSIQNDIESLDNLETYTETDKTILIIGIIDYCNYLKSKGEIEKPCVLLKKVSGYLLDNDDFHDFFTNDFNQCE